MATREEIRAAYDAADRGDSLSYAQACLVGLPVMIRNAMQTHASEAAQAESLLYSYCGGRLPRVPGCDTAMRLAVRIKWGCKGQGLTIEQAAAAEYIYRWRLALESRTFGVPHLFGLDGVEDVAA